MGSMGSMGSVGSVGSVGCIGHCRSALLEREAMQPKLHPRAITNRARHRRACTITFADTKHGEVRSDGVGIRWVSLPPCTGSHPVGCTGSHPVGCTGSHPVGCTGSRPVSCTGSRPVGEPACAHGEMGEAQRDDTAQALKCHADAFSEG